jgi:hypothetical protein
MGFMESVLLMIGDAGGLTKCTSVINLCEDMMVQIMCD